MAKNAGQKEMLRQFVNRFHHYYFFCFYHYFFNTYHFISNIIIKNCPIIYCPAAQFFFIRHTNFYAQDDDSYPIMESEMTKSTILY